MPLYTVRSVQDDVVETYRVIKLSKDWDTEAVYLIANAGRSWACTCPSKTRCKHPAIMAAFKREKKIDSGWLLDWDFQDWKPPITTEEG